MFLLRPDEATNNAMLYCLIVAAKAHDIDVVLPYAASNHHHTIVFDRHGTYPRFMEHFHALVARCMNRLRKRSENFWASVEPCAIRLVNREDVIAKMIYVAANPVKDRLVDRVHHWPGVNGYMNLFSGKPLQATRPRHFFRKKGRMPEHVSLELTLPPELGLRDEVLREVREGVEAIERELAAEIRAGRAHVVGARRIRNQPWSELPTTEVPHNDLRPRFAARDPESRKAALLSFRGFLENYRAARERCRLMQPSVFPYGTYKEHRYGGHPVGPPITLQ